MYLIFFLYSFDSFFSIHKSNEPRKDKQNNDSVSIFASLFRDRQCNCIRSYLIHRYRNRYRCKATKTQPNECTYFGHKTEAMHNRLPTMYGRTRNFSFIAQSELKFTDRSPNEHTYTLCWLQHNAGTYFIPLQIDLSDLFFSCSFVRENHTTLCHVDFRAFCLLRETPDSVMVALKYVNRTEKRMCSVHRIIFNVATKKSLS